MRVKPLIMLTGTLLLLCAAGCRHPLIGPADTIANKTVFPYCERLMDKHEKDELKRAIVQDQMDAFRRAVEEAEK